jgi:hypothetical protein
MFGFHALLRSLFFLSSRFSRLPAIILLFGQYFNRRFILTRRHFGAAMAPGEALNPSRVPGEFSVIR